MLKLSDCRPEVLAFALLMERELRANDHKPGWKEDSPEVLAQRVRQEAAELLEVASDHYANTRTPVPPLLRDKIAEETADVANMAMMVADVCGALQPPQEVRGE